MDQNWMAVVPYVPRPHSGPRGPGGQEEGELVAVRPSHSRCPLCLRDFEPPAAGSAGSSDGSSETAAVPPLLLDTNYFRSLPPGASTSDLLPFVTSGTASTKRPRPAGHVSPVPSDATLEDPIQQEEEPYRPSAEADAVLNEAADRTSGYYQQYFTELRCIGRGASGGVFLCRHMLDGISLGMFAVKKIPVGEDAGYLRKAIGEVQLLERIPRHPNIVEYHHTWFDYACLADFGPSVRCLFVLLEYATEGSLDGYVEAHGSGLSNATVWYFFLSALAGTAHLHANGVLHRDLKPQNLLLTQIDTHLPPRLFVSDFGTAALSGGNASGTNRTGGTGTEEYMAPELFETDSSSQQLKNCHTEASDVWSLGLILHYLACDGKLPALLPGQNGAVLLNVEGSSPIPRSPEMIALMRAMLQRDPTKRPSCAEILRSEYVVALRSSLLNELKTQNASPPRQQAATSLPTGSLPAPMPLLLKYRATSAGHRRGSVQASMSPPPPPAEERIPCPSRHDFADVGVQTEPVRFAD